MSLRVVAEKDVLDEHRAGTMWVYLVVFGLLPALVGYLAGRSAGEGFGPSLGAALATPTLFLVPLGALVLCHEAVSGERAAGTVRVLLAYPHSRRDVVLGLAAGRALVLCGVVGAGYVLAVPAYALGGGIPDPVSWGETAWRGLLFAATLSTMVVGLSASVRNGSRSLGLVLTAYAVFLVVWDQLPRLALYVANGFATPTSTPTWALVFGQLDPFSAVTTLLQGPLDGTPPPDLPAYATGDPLAVAVLLAWAAGLLVVGLRRFERTDL